MATINRESMTDAPAPGRLPRKKAAQQEGVQLIAFVAQLAWLFFGFILLLVMVLIIIGGN